MGLAAAIFGGTAAQPIEAVGNVLDKLFTSKDEKLTHAAIMAKLAMQPALAQIEINKVEAAHRSIFVAGWRPFIGWVGGFGVAWAFVGAPIFEWIVLLNGADLTPPTVSYEYLLELVLAMLGLGALRTVEKLKGRAK